MGSIQSEVAGLRLTVRHTRHHVFPDPLRRQLPSLNTRNRLDIGSYPFFKPML
jgi:hypothetical protein